MLLLLVGIGSFLSTGMLVAAGEPHTPWYKPWAKNPDTQVVSRIKAIAWKKDAQTLEERLEKLQSIVEVHGCSSEWQPSIESLINKIGEQAGSHKVRFFDKETDKEVEFKMGPLVGASSESTLWMQLFREVVKTNDINGIPFVLSKIGKVGLNTGFCDAPNASYLVSPKISKNGKWSASPEEMMAELIKYGFKPENFQEFNKKGLRLVHQVAGEIVGSCILLNYDTSAKLEELNKKRALKSKTGKPATPEESKSPEEQKKILAAFLANQKSVAANWQKVMEILVKYNAGPERLGKEGESAEAILHNCLSCQGKGKGSDGKKESPCKTTLEYLAKHKKAA